MALKLANNDGVWTAADKVYRSSDTELLKSGLLADVEVHCVETKRVWKVHKAILCSRSDWFKKALTGKFWKEGQTGIVRISETPEKHIDLVITFIYTGSVNLQKSFGDEHVWISSMKVWKLGDFFCLDELQKLATKGRDDAALHWAKTYALHLDKDTLSEFPPKMLESLVQAIAALYRDDRDDIDFRSAFGPRLLSMAISSISLLSNSAEFRSILHDIPGFAVEWSVELMLCVGAMSSLHGAHIRLRREVARKYGTSRCAKCNAITDTLYPNIVIWAKNPGKHHDEMVCESCFPMPTLEQWR